MNTAHPIVIAISRQLASGGAYVGRLVAHRLGYRYVDREVLRRAAEQLGLAEGEVRDREERLTGVWEQIVKTFTLGGPEAVYQPPAIPVVHDQALFEVESAIIRRIAREQSCVIVGKAASHVLQGHPGLRRVFLHAPREFRTQRFMKLYGIADVEEARARVRESDETRTRFHRSMTGGHWWDARRYDLCINTGSVDFIEAREMILALASAARRTV